MYSLEFKSNSTFWQACSYCQRKNCNDCPIPFDDTKVSKYLEQFLQDESKGNLDVELVWQRPVLRDTPLDKMFAEVGSTRDRMEVCTSSDQRPQNVTLSDCLQHSQTPEQLEEDNTWYCKGCKNHVQAFKSMQIYKV